MSKLKILSGPLQEEFSDPPLNEKVQKNTANKKELIYTTVTLPKDVYILIWIKMLFN